MQQPPQPKFDSEVTLEQPDRGEASIQDTPETPLDPAELEAQNQEKIGKNAELTAKVLESSIGSGLVTKDEVDAFRLTNPSVGVELQPIGKLTEALAITDAKLTSKSGTETEADTAKLKLEKAQLTIDLLYSVTALLKGKQEEVQRTLADLKAGKQPADTTKTPAKMIIALRGVSMQWDALSTSTYGLLPVLEKDYPSIVNPTELGKLTLALRSKADMGTQQLGVVEAGKTGVGLSTVMEEVSAELKKFYNIDIPQEEPVVAGVVAPVQSVQPAPAPVQNAAVVAAP